jgi:hypothetical protein
VIETEADIGGSRLAPGEEFCFACHPGLECFNSCCRQKRLPLWPYDVLRLCRGLGLGSGRVLERYATLEFDPRSGWPALRLALDDQGRCPLLTPAGCSVYPHRPAACRIYPLAWGLRPSGQGGGEVYFRQKTHGCRGWEEPVTHTPAGWVADQGLEPYLESSRQLQGLWMHSGRRGRLQLSQAQTHAVISALYNLEVFRQAAGRPGFAAAAGLEPDRVERALADDEELLLVGRDWLAARLFGA